MAIDNKDRCVRGGGCAKWARYKVCVFTPDDPVNEWLVCETHIGWAMLHANPQDNCSIERLNIMATNETNETDDQALKGYIDGLKEALSPTFEQFNLLREGSDYVSMLNLGEILRLRWNQTMLGNIDPKPRIDEEDDKPVEMLPQMEAAPVFNAFMGNDQDEHTLIYSKHGHFLCSCGALFHNGRGEQKAVGIALFAAHLRQERERAEQ